MREFTSENQKIGELGEAAAVKFLKKKRFEIIERNYTRKWGEIDIIALSPPSWGIFAPKNNGILHFIEVKTVSDEDFEMFSRETATDMYDPEEKLHFLKAKRIIKAVETYISENDPQNDWCIDLITVYLDPKKDRAQVIHTKDVL